MRLFFKLIETGGRSSFCWEIPPVGKNLLTHSVLLFGQDMKNDEDTSGKLTKVALYCHLLIWIRSDQIIPVKNAGRHRRSLPLSLIYFCYIFWGVFVLVMFMWFSYNLCLNGNQADVFPWFPNLNEPPPFSFAAITHCTFINLASVSMGQKCRLCGGTEPARDQQEVLRHTLISSVWNSVGDLGGQFMDQHAWGRARRDRGMNATLRHYKNRLRFTMVVGFLKHNIRILGLI